MSRLVKFPGHHHSLFIDLYIGHPNYPNLRVCSSCGDKIYELWPYYCKVCYEAWHRDCMPSSFEIYNTCRPNHKLKLLFNGAPKYSDGKCDICREKLGDFVYHCSTCNFSLDARCGECTQHRTIHESKCHNHPLTIMTRQVSFVCNVCGTYGERSPYVCLDCSFMIHRDCIDRPHVININRHDHRISHTPSFRPGKGICRVCRLNIDWMYGAYSCSKCPDFVVHSKCATSEHVWDGEELKGVPEEEDDDSIMFNVIEENLINHRMHPSHNLRLVEDGVVREESLRCELCQDPIYSDKFYSCVECENFILHETCGTLTSKKRHGLCSTRLSLQKKEMSDYSNVFVCKACDRHSSGPLYRNDLGGLVIDLRCASLDWSCDHDSHPHTLFLTTLDRDMCGGCGNSQKYVLRCVDCKFNLCYKCATYPKKIKHRCDDHPLVLCFGEAGTYWCEVCEAKIDSKKWFYKCEECSVVCHIGCLIGDFANIKPGLRELEDGIACGVVRNNGVTRPHCHTCTTLCLVPFIFSFSNNYLCSIACLREFLDASTEYTFA